MLATIGIGKFGSRPEAARAGFTRYDLDQLLTEVGPRVALAARIEDVQDLFDPF